jgi:glutamine synthetase
VVATELEFYLIDDRGREPARAALAAVGQAAAPGRDPERCASSTPGTGSSPLYEACEAMDIPADTTISEAGPGQFEINLMHQADALKAADDAWLFKLLVKGLARSTASPPASWPSPTRLRGNGLHVHFSVLDATAQHLRRGGQPGRSVLRHAVAGCLAGDAGLGADLRAPCNQL